MRNWLAVFIYALLVFVAAFLLFAVQPLMGRFILPWFGGSPDVWTTCMLFFQVFLLLGYLYAHLLVNCLPSRLQAFVQVILVTAAVAMVRIVPAESWKPDGGIHPILHITALLAVCIGLPYFVLASTGPLIQGWFSKTVSDRSPYKLYSLSNAASLLALLSYPFVIEPYLARRTQALLWSVGLGFFAFMTVCGAVVLWLRSSTCGVADKFIDSDVDGDHRVSNRRRLLWMLLSAGSCIVLLAVTNKICQDITVIPFFWVAPLSVYLLSFIICFHSETWYVRNFWVTAFILSFVALVAATMLSARVPAIWYILIHIGSLFCCCMVFHGELYAKRPVKRHLTGYYLMISTGGALGGMFVVVIAPLIFNTYFELYVGMLMCCGLILLTAQDAAAGSRKRRLAWICLISVAGVVAYAMQETGIGTQGKVVAAGRNFFGVLTVRQEDAGDPILHRYVMQHGATNHGLQFTHRSKQNEPTAYYGRQSGVALVIESMSDRANLRVGIVGLGVGTIAAYGRNGDHFTFYEINPEVTRQARDYFTYLENCPAQVDIIAGDARLSLERQSPQQFDLLVLDAFTSDAVPVHLLTAEAFEIYLKHLKPDGVIAAHISTIHVDLHSVVRRLAEHFSLSNVWIETHASNLRGIFDSDWIIMAKDGTLLDQPQIKRAKTEYDTDLKDIDLWTDDHVNLLQVLK